MPDGDVFGVGEDDFADFDGGGGGGVIADEHVADLAGEGLDEAAGAGLGEADDALSGGVVVDGAGDVVVEGVEGMRGVMVMSRWMRWGWARSSSGTPMWTSTARALMRISFTVVVESWVG